MDRCETAVRDIVNDAERKAVHRLVLFQLLVDRKDLIRCRILAAETIASADNDGIHPRAVVRRLDIEVKRLAERSRLLRAVEDGDLLYRLREILEEVLNRERTIEMNGEQTDLLALCVEVFGNLLRRLADRAHCDDDAIRIGRAVVVEEMVLAPRDLRHLRHCLFDKLRDSVIVAVDRLASLEVDVGVLCRTAYRRMIRVECTAAELIDCIPVEDLREIGIVHDLDLLNLMRGTEAIEEVDERNASLDRDEMRHGSEIHDLLYARLCEHGNARLTCRHDILMIAEDVQRGRCDRTCADMEHSRQKFARDLIHIRNHEQESLRCRIGRRECTGLE